MRRTVRKYSAIALWTLLAALAGVARAGAQELAPRLEFGLGLGMGTEFFLSDEHAYQRLSLLPHFGVGPFALGLDLDLHFRILTEGGVEIRRADWVPTPERRFLDVYLTKIVYLRWAERGAPLYLQFGSIEGVTFGNGFIVDHYANTLFLARRRVFGGEVGLDGELVGVPFLGTQLFVGNLVAFDLIGTRVYVRPFSLGDSLFLQQILIGAAYVFDRMPAEDGRVAGYGIDLRVPLLYTGPVSVAALLDGAQLHGSHHRSNRAKIPTGGAIGLDGKVAWFDWRAQLRYHSYNFIPGYFGPAYDTVRRRNYEALRVQEEKEDEPDRLGHLGWLAQVGIRLDSGAGVSLSLDGPFELSEKPGPASGYAHLRARGFLPAGIVGGLSFDLTYDQTVDPANARSRGWLRALMIAETASVIRARVNYQFGPVVLSYVYSRLRDGDGAPVISSGIESMVTLW